MEKVKVDVMFELIKSEVNVQTANRPRNIEYHRVFDVVKVTGNHHFLHGLAIDEWNGRLVVSFAFNEKDENTVTEQLMICWSEDGGFTWTEPKSITAPKPFANSHGVFLKKDNELWCFAPRFMGVGTRPRTKKGHELLYFTDLQWEAWQYEENGWREKGLVGDDFWPLSEPMRLQDGSWLVAGVDTYWRAAIAKSHGDDVLHWEIIKPETDEEVFTEAGAWAKNNEVLLVMRNQSCMVDGKSYAAVALSRDYGNSFSVAELSNLPMATTKPFCGRLTDGRPYLLFNESVEGAPYCRSRLLLGIGNADDFGVRQVYVVDEGYHMPSGNRLQLSYPYAKQIDNRLYIVYSYESVPGIGYNHNDAMLAIVNVEDLA